ncbi:hypothetical protein EV702DRAFT_1049310 [Suillus placidus]|uniref:Uncharacterized protein n=1 Tax=Suillus placidus TaxID=48579 RepID=A0A9P7CY41_9AGAM|nr:hypothetical protein EV702DRAFT_1049310 [Suillus placidus]
MFALQGDSSNDRNFYGPISQNPRLGWGEPYTPSPLSPGMPLPGDPFTDSAPAQLQRYQLHQDCCKSLEIQVIKLTTECDAFQSILQQLASALQQSGNPLSFDPTFPAQLGHSSNDTNRPTPQTHPKIRFWNQIDYIEWLDTSMGQLSHRRKLGYLKDKNGGPIAATMVKGIHKALRAGWCELTNRKLAPKTWGVLSASGRKLIHTLMEDAYPLLKFADNGWKLEYLASTSYSAWRRTYLTDDGNWKSKNHDNKEEDESEGGNAGDSQTLSLKGKKRKKAKFSIKSEVPQKKMKVDSETAGTQTLVVSPLPSSSSPTPSAAMAPTSLTLDLPTPDPPTSLPMALTSLTPGHPTPSAMAPTSTMLADSPMLPPMALTSPPLDSLMIASPASASTPELLPTAPSLLSPKFGPDSDCNKENIPPKLATPTPRIRVNVVVANPLAALALAASKVQLPPLLLGPTPPIVPPAPNGADSESTIQNHADLSTADDTTTSKTTTVSTKSSTKGKMCPSGTKNGRNLCAQRWLKKLKTNGTTEEFCAYYRDLTLAQRKLYDDESASLVANKSWNKTSFDGTMY